MRNYKELVTEYRKLKEEYFTSYKTETLNNIKAVLKELKEIENEMPRIYNNKYHK